MLGRRASSTAVEAATQFKCSLLLVLGPSRWGHITDDVRATHHFPEANRK
jgi:hypothetical protein